ncbi:tRNA preQ1(34) S-adenosylmethionine ribosyltransferase-isomerase QueA [Sporomusa acidovorans]|uniref:S-adenosylmethionine:tRNA ribosyltransferase-isomerase n=1 Tax=Sporomusa acidovorans (strain ATCC 49682 / DSM 3132 / Mol) TaxID=1123286 RepID=A0ABZ3J4B4_SPOA4|nr:tRNA preQ1(34) S-adenosylmethionine ribosyltransferase-isomerase QueA [Sporomusa acidovorans]OZC20890.1 S-adenosylmethionine:tRNA ribosyltransferase-isomerase [Sporomusa acidovorans DSM 3132]SDE60195.1 S-adenosylmethionine:tRNA ribosyltransferase-isomerase [Sporomusa acidovorans]
MLVSDFDYYLPEELIAQQPVEPRDHSRLLVLDRQNGHIEHSKFYNLPQYLQPGDTLVFNDTRVIPARLLGFKPETGGKVEVFLLNRTMKDEWEVLVKPGKKARPGTIIEFSDALRCEVLRDTDFGGRVVRFSYQGVFEEILDILGETPLPPYIKAKLADKERYQTVYARERGSAAAPTAGLHFTRELMNTIKQMGINLTFVTLHVGLGTFRPVSVENISEHVMHREHYSVPEETAAIVNQTLAAGNRVIAVGTTAVRTLETAGASGRLEAKSGWTEIFIYPGYDFKIVKALITNFHLPKSTLLMLVSALASRKHIFNAYQEAVNKRYRFFSFGDAMFIR